MSQLKTVLGSFILAIAVYQYSPTFLNTIGITTPRYVESLAKELQYSTVIVRDDLGHGTGVPILDGSYIITNYHVVDEMLDPSSNRIVTHDGTEHSFVVVKVDPKTDLALLKIGVKLKPQQFARDIPSVGAQVIAVGSPLFLQDITTIGFVMAPALHLDIGTTSTGAPIGGVKTGHTAAISPGNSGGPLYNTEGEIVGLNELFIKDSDSLNFAVGLGDIKEFLKEFR